MFEELGQKAKVAYESGRQLWIVSENPLDTALTILYRKKVLDNSLEYGFNKILDRDNVYRQIFELTLPDWLIQPGSIQIDYSIFKNKKLRKKRARATGIPESVLELIAKESIESIEKTDALDKKLYDEINFRLNVASELPDPIDWVNKTYKYHEKSPKNLIGKISKKIQSKKRQREMVADISGKLDKTAIDFILKYWGDQRITENIFLVVSSMKIPLQEHENWEFYLFPEKTQKS